MMASSEWASDPQVIAALTAWDSAQRSLDAVRPETIPDDVTELDDPTPRRPKSGYDRLADV